MECPVKTEYHTEILSVRKVTGKLPKDCRFPVSYAKAELTTLKTGTVLRQYVSNYHFYMDLYELNLHTPLKVGYSIENPTMFLYFVLNENTCYAAASEAGSYISHFSEGRHYLLYIVFRVDWVTKNPEHYPKLIDLLMGSETDRLFFPLLPKCPIAGYLKEALYVLYKLQPVKDQIFEDELAIKCKQLMIRYHEAVLQKLNLPVYRVKAFIDENYSDAELNNKSLLVVSKTTTGKTMIRNFKNQFGITPHAYLIQVRMHQAKQLLANNIHVNMVYPMVGYKDLRSFNIQHKKFFNFPPSAHH